MRCRRNSASWNGALLTWKPLSRRPKLCNRRQLQLQHLRPLLNLGAGTPASASVFWLQKRRLGVRLQRRHLGLRLPLKRRCLARLGLRLRLQKR